MIIFFLCSFLENLTGLPVILILKPKNISSVPGRDVFTVVDAAEISFDTKASNPTWGVDCQLTEPSKPELS